MPGETKEELRMKILLAANTLFLDRGVRDVSVDDVCRSVFISKKTFYTVFQQKEDLAVAVLEYNFDEKKKLLEKTFGGLNPIEAMFRLKSDPKLLQDKPLAAMVHDMRKYYPEAFAAHEEKRAKRIGKDFLEIVQKAVDDGYFKSDIDTEATILLLRLIHRAIADYMDGKIPGLGRKISKSRLVDAYERLCRDSLFSDKGWEEYRSLQAAKESEKAGTKDTKDN